MFEVVFVLDLSEVSGLVVTESSEVSGSVVVGLELKNKNDIIAIKEKMNRNVFQFQYLNEKEDLFAQIIW